MSALKATRRLKGWRRWWDQLQVEARRSDIVAFVALTSLAVGLVVVGLIFQGLIPHIAMLLPMFFASMWLNPRRLPWFVIGCLVGACVLLSAEDSITIRTVVRVIVTFTIGLVILTSALRRSRLGVSGNRSESMFVDLRDRITSQGLIPDLGPQWLVESVWRSAGGTAFAGDFVVASHDRAGEVFDLVVVDVSGKGVDAGSRALLLSGAFAGILSAVPTDRFLSEANRYLLRQNWDEGFATAIHLHLDRTIGVFQLRKAGHPPAIWLRAGSGTSKTLESDGPILGLMEDADFETVEGLLEHGDALMLYTDGMVETVSRDIGSGIDWLAGHGVRLFQDGFEGGAQTVIDKLQVSDDDRALVIVHRA